jgi:16S rRNA (cytidine1402-2'-O)-methyltransferase
MQGAEPAAGVLYLVGTPIGNRGDLSPRAQHVLGGVDRIACEDTRHSGLLLHQLGIKGRLVSFHEHNQASRIPELLAALEAGESIAVISDAGLPGISDPGEALVAAARTTGRTVICVPGPCAVTTALVSSGLPAGRFCFEGFLPPKPTQRRARIRELASEARTVVLFEAPHRLVALLEDLLAELGERPVAVTRELTKRHEQQVGPTLSGALAHFRAHSPQGEFTLVLGGAAVAAAEALSQAELLEALQALLEQGLSRNEAARQLAQQTGLAKRELYALLHHEGEAN